METNSEEFNITDWLIKALEIDFSSEENFETFALEIFEEISQFARLSKNEIINNFSQLNKDVNHRLRTSLSHEFLEHFQLESSHTLKITKSHDKVLNDLYDLIQLASSTEDQINGKDLSSLYDIKQITTEKVTISNINHLYELLNNTLAKNHSIILEKLRASNKTIQFQNRKINNLEIQNKSLINTINKLSQGMEKVESTLKSKNSFPPIPLFNTTAAPSFSMVTASNSASSSRMNNNNINTPTPRTPATKRRSEQNDNTSLNKKSLTTSNRQNNNNNRNFNQQKQKEILNFNSFDVNSNNVAISNNKTNEYKIAGDKQKEKKARNYQNKQYNKSVGLGSGSNLLVRKRKFYVYFGNIDVSATTEQVESTLKSILNEIEYEDFVELNTEVNERKTKSFKFSIGYLDRAIINDKNLWPKYTIVNKYKMSKIEWDVIAAKIASRNKSNNSSASNVQSQTTKSS